MKCTSVSLWVTLIGILLVSGTLLYSLCPLFLVQNLNYGFHFQSILFGTPGTRQQELISVKVVSRNRRSRRDANKSIVIALFSPRRNETMTVNALESGKVIPSDLVLFLDGRELDDKLTNRSRSVGTLTGQNRFYTGTVYSPSGGLGRIALTSFESMNREPEEFFGLLSLNGVDYIIEPSPELLRADDDGTHVLIEANGDNGGRRCVSRGMDPVEQKQQLPNEDLQIAPLTINQSSNLEVTIDAKSQPKKGNWVKTPARFLELAVFADAAFYKRMKKKFPQNTLQNTITYILASVNNMNLLYKDPSIGFDNMIDIRLNYLEVLTRNPKKLNDAKGRESVYLDSFCKFAASKNTDVTNWDHAMMLTGTDL
ncbi:unnamed protein product, partial [Allacma fusca]